MHCTKVSTHFTAVSGLDSTVSELPYAASKPHSAVRALRTAVNELTSTARESVTAVSVLCSKKMWKHSVTNARLLVVNVPFSPISRLASKEFWQRSTQREPCVDVISHISTERELCTGVRERLIEISGRRTTVSWRRSSVLLLWFNASKLRSTDRRLTTAAILLLTAFSWLTITRKLLLLTPYAPLSPVSCLHIAAPREHSCAQKSYPQQPRCIR